MGNSSTNLKEWRHTKDSESEIRRLISLLYLYSKSVSAYLSTKTGDRGKQIAWVSLTVTKSACQHLKISLINTIYLVCLVCPKNAV